MSDPALAQPSYDPRALLRWRWLGYVLAIAAIAILPLVFNDTYWRTNLHTLHIGAPVNIEADVLVKLAWQRMQTAQKQEFDLTEAWLVANGY